MMVASDRRPSFTARLLALIPWSLALAVVVVLLGSLPDAPLESGNASRLFVYSLLTALALVFGALLIEGELSIAHIVGMIAFLSMPGRFSSAVLWAVFIGSLIGGSLLVIRHRLQLSGRRRRLSNATNVVYVIARATLSLYAASRAYSALGGPLPLSFDLSAPWPGVWAVTVFCLLYLGLYLLIFLLELYSDGRQVGALVRQNLLQIVGLLFVPMPFAIWAADVIKGAPVAGFIMLSVALALVIGGLHAYSRSEDRLRRQLAELRSLSVVTQTMRAHLNLDTLLKTAYVQVAHLLETNSFLVALYDTEDRGRLRYPFIIRNGVEETYLPRTRSTLEQLLIQRVLETNLPLLISEDVNASAARMGLHPPPELLHSWLGVPLIAGERTLGAIAVASRDPYHHFGPDDLRLLNIVAASASIAIENAQLYEQQTARADQLSTLNKISSLLSGTLSADSVLDTVISSASTISQATAVAVYLYWDEAQAALALVRSAGLSDDFTTDPPEPLLSRFQTPKTIHRQLPLVAGDIARDARCELLRPVLKKEAKSAFIELPLGVGESGLGVLILYFNDSKNFGSEYVELLRTFATQVSQAINNARLYTSADQALERRVEQLFALAALGRMLTATMDIQQIGDLVLGYATDATQALQGVFILRDEESRRLEVIAQRGYPENTFKSLEVLTHGLAGNVLSSGRIARVGDVRQESGYLPLVAGTQSQLIVPIQRGREIVGLIQLEADVANAFSEEDSYFVGQLASQAVIAVDNVHLFRRITEARDRLQVLLDAMEEAIILIANSGQIALANPRVALLNLSPGQLLNKNVSDLLEDQQLQLAARLGFQSNARMRQFLADLPHMRGWQDSDRTSYEIQAEHGLLYIQRQIIAVRDEGGHSIGVLLVFYNRTEEQELTKAREELSRMIVHDLRSPLTAVTTSLRLLRDVVPKENDVRSIIEATTDASQRAVRKLLSRVDALLDISRMESGQLTLDTEPTELATIADSVCVELSPLAHELNVQIAAQVGDQIPLLDIDPDKIERVLLNLVDNALKYAPQDSAVYIRAYKAGTNDAKEHFVRVDVIDHGPGVPDEYKQRLFDRFVQIEGRRKVRRGVGLGLTFCRTVVEAHGGRIWIEDNPEGGSIFAFTLPVVRLDLLLLDEEDDLPLGRPLPPGPSGEEASP